MALDLQAGCVCVGLTNVANHKLKDKLEMLDASAGRMAAKSSDKALKLLLMPEFFGSLYDNDIRTFRPLSDADRKALLDRAAEISQKHSWIVIPGTVLIPVSGVPEQGAFTKANGRVQSCVPVFYKGALIARFFKKFYSTGEIPCVPRMKDDGKWPVATPLMGAFDTEKLRAASEQVREKLVPDMFTVEGHDFGLEICNDIGMLSTVLGSRRGPGCHIIVSQGMSLGYIYNQAVAKYIDRDGAVIGKTVAKLPEAESINQGAIGYEGVFVQCDGPASRCATKELFGHWRLHLATDLLALEPLAKAKGGYGGIPSCFVLYPPVPLSKFTLTT
ncbi:hypothetical protein [Hyalangium rubrum]|uniref:CN hydrolase domain-containing protein n=1 Tax=Hyalangium rubrum TaxID=3103134 RepID=A0ABU5H0G0_9BACT|nr:hypothetical protein [Hyalangium sp. s54d21]MDY7226943.1 hypothetical protein [Hyalangium sp. s54d21]